MSQDPMKPMDNASDSPSYVTGPVATDAPDAVRTGVAPAGHPELDGNEHWAAKLTKIADEESPGGEYTSAAHDASRPNGVMRAHAPAAHWSSTKLATGEE
jgi:hypothetical protein